MLTTSAKRMLSVRLCAFALITLAAPAVLSQTITTGEVTGVVTDPAAKVVIGATVQLKSNDTGDSRSVQSSASGVYRFPFVKPGSYELSAKSQGLKSDTGTLAVAVGQVQVLDLHLKLEEPKTVVLVTDAAPLLNPDNDNLVYTLSSRQLGLLPLPGADLVAVAYSTPGVVINNNNIYGFGNFVLQGVGGVSNLFTFNGIDDMDPYYNLSNSGITGLLLGANEVQEASVVQNAFEGQYGRQAGAQVNYVTKSGTNFYHGNLLYSYNGDVLNANDFFANVTGTPRPRAIANQYAASFGGPAIRNRLFFFADTEGDRFVVPLANSVVAIPSPALESYILRSIRPSQVPFYQKMFQLYNNAPGINHAVPVTTGNGSLQDSSGTLGCGSLAGTPTGTGGSFGVAVPCALAWGKTASLWTSEWLLSSRLDYNISAKQRVFFRFKTDQGYAPTPNLSSISPAFDLVSPWSDYEGQVNHTLLITPRLMNNFIGSVTYNSYETSVSDLAAALRVFPFRLGLHDGGANGSFGIAPLGPPQAAPYGRREAQFQIIDDISYGAGRHFFRAGVNYRYNPEADLAFAHVDVGHFQIFSMSEFAGGALTGNGFFTQNFSPNPVLHIHLYNLGAYVQDQWAATPHLKLTAALRLERTGNPYCVHGCFNRLTEPFPELSKGLSIPYNQSIQAGLGHAFYNVEPVVPEPRLSVAYSPAWLHGTVLRAGIGLFADLYPTSFANNLAGIPPNNFPALFRTGLINAGGPGSAPAIAAASANAFQSGFAAGDTLAQIQQAVAPSPLAPPNYSSIPSTVRSPKSLQWDFEVQRQLGVNNVLALRYMGNHGYDIFLADPNANASADPARFPNGFAGLPAEIPDPRFAVVSQLTNDGYSNYHALLITFRRAFAHSFQGQISYNWSHALDTVSNGGLLAYNFSSSLIGQINPLSRRSLNYSNADYDVRHNITGDFIWEMPVRLREPLINTIFGRWSLGTKLSAHAGTPFSIVNSDAVPSASLTVLADVTDPNIRTACGRAATNTPCFTASQFAPAATQTNFGNLPRNSFRGPRYFNIDSTLFKTIPIRERMQLTLGASAYNLFNHPNFADPNADIASSGLGLITSTTLNPSGPYGLYGGPSGRALMVHGKVVF
jgi:hypothetical protein